MSLPKQTSWSDLVKGLRRFGFEGVFYKKSGPHPAYMTRGDDVLHIPNEHKGDIREPLLKMGLEQAGISAAERNDRKRRR